MSQHPLLTRNILEPLNPLIFFPIFLPSTFGHHIITIRRLDLKAFYWGHLRILKQPINRSLESLLTMLLPERGRPDYRHHPSSDII